MTKKLKYTELRSLDSVIEQLQEVLDGLRAGVLYLARGEQQLQLTPGAVLDFSLYAERKGVQERFELAFEWRRQELTIGSGPQEEIGSGPQEEIDDEAVTVRHSSPPGGQLRPSQRASSSDTEWFERLYREARTPSSDDRLRLDEKRFADSLAAAGLEPRLQQELFTLAREADAEGRERLFKEPSISELIASTLGGAA